MRAIRMLLVSALAMGSVSAHAGELDVKRLTQLLEKSQTIDAKFSQLTLGADGTSLQETAGQMTVKRPGLFYWHTYVRWQDGHPVGPGPGTGHHQEA
jgi:outer membrane lipoprotein carrier protein